MAAYTFVNARRTFHRPPLVGVDHGLCTHVVVSCCSDVTAETASAVVGQSDSGVASEVAVSTASVGVRRVVSTEGPSGSECWLQLVAKMLIH